LEPNKSFIYVKATNNKMFISPDIFYKYGVYFGIILTTFMSFIS